MKRDKIEKQLRLWFSQMLLKYTWLIIKYEYSDVEDCYLVSFSPEKELEQSDDFSKDALDFENRMNREYGDDAPLFCDEESLFKLSSSAEVLEGAKCIVSYDYQFEDDSMVSMLGSLDFVSVKGSIDVMNTEYVPQKFTDTKKFDYTIAA